MSKWHTILGRETMEHFPCVPEGIDVGMNAIDYFCSSEETPECKIAELCPLRPIYEEYMAMCVALKAALTNDWTGHVTTPKSKAEHYRNLSQIPTDQESSRSKELREWAAAWEGIA